MPAISGPEDGPVAVTGASGFIGSQLVNNLVTKGYNVRACVRDINRTEQNIVPACDARKRPRLGVSCMPVI